MKTTRLPEMACLSCNKALSAATTPLGNYSPEPGNVTVCWYCGHIMVFGEGLRLRELAPDEIIDIAGDKTILAIQRARSKVRR
jgi:hypothetical protein